MAPERSAAAVESAPSTYWAAVERAPLTTPSTSMALVETARTAMRGTVEKRMVELVLFCFVREARV